MLVGQAARPLLHGGQSVLALRGAAPGIDDRRGETRSLDVLALRRSRQATLARGGGRHNREAMGPSDRYRRAPNCKSPKMPKLEQSRPQVAHRLGTAHNTAHIRIPAKAELIRSTMPLRRPRWIERCREVCAWKTPAPRPSRCAPACSISMRAKRTATGVCLQRYALSLRRASRADSRRTQTAARETLSRAHWSQEDQRLQAENVGWPAEEAGIFEAESIVVERRSGALLPAA